MIFSLFDLFLKHFLIIGIIFVVVENIDKICSEKVKAVFCGFLLDTFTFVCYSGSFMF